MISVCLNQLLTLTFYFLLPSNLFICSNWSAVSPSMCAHTYHVRTLVTSYRHFASRKAKMPTHASRKKYRGPSVVSAWLSQSYVCNWSKVYSVRHNDYFALDNSVTLNPRIRIRSLWFTFFPCCFNKWWGQKKCVWVTQPLFIPLLHFSPYPHLLITHIYSITSLALILPTNHFVTKLRLSFHWWDIIAGIISWKKKRELVIYSALYTKVM